MARKSIAIGYVPAVLTAGIGIVAVGLFGTPVATHHQASGCFMTQAGTCEEVPNPTDVGCPAGDFQCMFDKKLKQPPPPPSSDG